MSGGRDWVQRTEIEPCEAFGGDGEIDLGAAVLADPVHRARFARPASTLAVEHWRYQEVALFPGLALVFKDRQVVAESRYCIFGDEAERAAAALAGPTRRLDGRRCYLGFNRVHANHHHIISQIVHAVAGYARDPEFCDSLLLLPARAAHLTRAFAAAGLELPEIAWLEPHVPVSVADLTCSSLLYGCDGPSRHGARVFARMRRRCELPAQSPPWIYVWRLDSASRPLRNEDALVAMLTAHGVLPVVLSELTLERQVALFRGARLVVGPHGAGLSNIGFCEPGARLYELFPSHYVNPCMFLLAQQQGLHYACDIHPADPGPGQWRHQVPWSVDVAAVERRLVRLLQRHEIIPGFAAAGIELAAASL